MQVVNSSLIMWLWVHFPHRLGGIQFARPYLMAVQIMNLSYMTIQVKMNFIPNWIVVIIHPNHLLFEVSSRPASTPLQKFKMLNIKTYVLLNNVDNSWQPWIIGKWIKVKESHAGLSFHELYVSKSLVHQEISHK